MTEPPAGPVADFWAELHRLVRACRVPQTEIASVLGLSGASVSELLNGRRRRVPEWEVVRRILALCARRRGADGAAPQGMSLDEGWWRGRHAELERTAESSAPRSAGPTGPPTPAPPDPGVPSAVAPIGLDASECAQMTEDMALRLLADGRPGLTVAVYQSLCSSQDHEAVCRFLDQLMDGFPRRVRAAHGLPRTALLHAARVMLLEAAVPSDPAWTETVTSDLFADLRHGIYAALAHVRSGGYRVAPYVPYGPSSVPPEAVVPDSLHEAVDRYLRLAAPLAMSCPEFAVVSGVPDTGAQDVREASGEQTGTGLSGLGELLAEFAGQAELSAPRRARLRAPIASIDSPGPVVPSLAEGYVNPRFRVTGPHGPRDGCASDKWWRQQWTYDTVEHFLAVHLLSAFALLSPLVVLGDPGAGKSLLTRLLAARLPPGEFRALRVELRHTPTEGDVQDQLEHALRRDTGRRVSWPDWSEAEPGVIPVVVLDGFDELLQAGAQRLGSRPQWSYLRQIEEFQHREARHGRPVVVIVTSRTVVADRTDLPPAGQVMRLEPFGQTEIERWLDVWQRTNGAYLERRGLRPPTPAVVMPHAELAAQPLLLLMLALYDAVDNALHRLVDEVISRTQLYDRLLTEFVRRQVDKDGSLPPAERAAAVDRELHRLSVVAIGMFHRGAQALSNAEAERDLRALDTADREEGGRPELLFGRFFFMHEAQAVVAQERLRSYEFLHATFGEHLAARLIERALWRLATAAVGDHSTGLDDGELYALLSFAPLTDRAQLVADVWGMLAAWPPGPQRSELPSIIAELFRESEWEPEHRSDPGHAPTRVTRTYRNALYEVNLVLLAVAADGDVYASHFLGTRDLAAQWQRRAAMWRSQLSDESWDLFIGVLTVDRCWRSDRAGEAEERPDLRIGISNRHRLSADHDVGWVFGRADASLPWPEQQDAGAVDVAANIVQQVMFGGDRHAELLLHAVHPLLRRMPSTLLAYGTDGVTRLETAAHSLISLLTRQTYSPAGSVDVYDACLDVIGKLSRNDVPAFLEALSRQLVHDIPSMPDEALASVMLRLCRHLEELCRHLEERGPVGPAARHILMDCVHEAVGRHDPGLTPVLARITELLARQRDSSLPDLLRLTRAARSSSAWMWCGMPQGTSAREYLDDLLDDLDVPQVGARHPDALVTLLRVAADLGLCDWLAARAPEVLRALPPGAFGLLRPSDLPPLREALPPGAYADEFMAVERAWRCRQVASDLRLPL